ncbi:MAG: pilin [Patescibacteria group bacterium]
MQRAFVFIFSITLLAAFFPGDVSAVDKEKRILELYARCPDNSGNDCKPGLECKDDPANPDSTKRCFQKGETESGNRRTDFGVDPVEQSIDLGNRDVIDIATAIINVALGLLGIIAVVIVLYGGFKWMTAGGNEDGVKDARKIIFAGIIGLGIILAAFAISKFTIAQLSKATESGDFQGLQE